MQNTQYKLYDKTLLDMSETQNDRIARETKENLKIQFTVWSDFLPLCSVVILKPLTAMNRPEMTDSVQQTGPEDIMSPKNAI